MTVAGPPRRGEEVRGLAVNLAGVGLVVVVGAVVMAAGAALGLAVGGRPQALGAVLGAALVTGSYVFGLLAVSLVAAYAPRASLLVALLTYVVQVAALALVLTEVQASQGGSGVDPRWTGGAVVVATVVWLVLLVVRALRTVPPVPDRGVG